MHVLGGFRGENMGGLVEGIKGLKAEKLDSRFVQLKKLLRFF